MHRIGLDRTDVVVRSQFAADVGPERGQPDGFLGHHPRVEHVALAAAHAARESQEPPHQGAGRRASLGGVLEQGRPQGLVPLVLGQHHACLHGREHGVRRRVVGEPEQHLVEHDLVQDLASRQLRDPPRESPRVGVGE